MVHMVHAQSPACQNHRVRFATELDEPQAAVSRFDTGDGGVIGPEAHDILARVRGGNGGVDRNEVRKHDAVLGQASE